MIDPVGRVRHPTSAESIVSSGNRNQPQPSQSFATALTDKLAGTSRNPNSPSKLPTSLPPGEQVVTRQDTGSSNSQTTGLDGLVITYPGSTTGTTPTVSSSPQAPSFDQTYWASQPAAVQQLQNIQNPTERAAVAEQLSQEGYSIDVPIMVWGWDPGTTMSASRSHGLHLGSFGTTTARGGSARIDVRRQLL